MRFTAFLIVAAPLMVFHPSTTYLSKYPQAIMTSQHTPSFYPTILLFIFSSLVLITSSMKVYFLYIYLFIYLFIFIIIFLLYVCTYLLLTYKLIGIGTEKYLTSSTTSILLIDYSRKFGNISTR